MRVHEKMRHIDVCVTGMGTAEIKYLISRYIPGATIIDDEDEEENDDETFIKWEDSDLHKEITLQETPGKVLRAYREREGLSLVELARLTGIQYTNISAMEHDTRVIGLSSAKRLGKTLHCDYTRFFAG